MSTFFSMQSSDDELNATDMICFESGEMLGLQGSVKGRVLNKEDDQSMLRMSASLEIHCKFFSFVND